MENRYVDTYERHTTELNSDSTSIPQVAASLCIDRLMFSPRFTKIHDASWDNTVLLRNQNYIGYSSITSCNMYN
jgi:hypothetical protein